MPKSILVALLLSGCLHLHHVQIGDIDQTEGYELRPFDIKVSETGISIDEAKQVASVFASQSDRENMGTVSDVIQMFQVGPRTGKHVYSDSYAENLGDLLRAECPSGQITGLIAVRETRDYPVISGEIIKVLGYCMIKRSS